MFPKFRKAEMARYTIREFTEAVGLGKDRDSVTRSGIILKALCGLGIAKEVGRKSVGNGRPATLYEVPDPIVIPLGVAVEISEPEAKQASVPVKEVVAATAVSDVSAATQGYYYDDDEDD
jgi:hypothetical protein